MNGAQALISTLVDADVDVCFSNPGTSEMHFVAALDSVPRMRAILGLFEGVVTGAADGFARMAGRPAAALLHLGPGLGNGLANLHNANRAGTPVVVIVGDHAGYHLGLDAPLESDIVTVARNVSQWIRRAEAPSTIGRDATEAVHAAMAPPGQVTTLILPADVSWGDGGVVGQAMAPSNPAIVDDDHIEETARTLRTTARGMLFLGGPVLADPHALAAAAAVAHATGCRMLAETFPTRMARGAGVADVDRLAFGTRQACDQLDGVSDLVLVGAAPPVAFFAHPGQPSTLAPDAATIHTLTSPADDGRAALEALAAALNATPAITTGHGTNASDSRPQRPSGRLDPMTAAAAIGALLPEGAIVSDEAITSGVALPAATADSPRHDWLSLTGGAIGQGLPVATGAAVASPDRPVLSLQADGSAMYTIQALWTQAREGLDVTTVVFNNGSYEILDAEMQRVGAAGAGPRAQAQFDLTKPRLDFVALAAGMGVPGTRATTAEEFSDQLAAALAEPGPTLVEAMIPRLRDLR